MRTNCAPLLANIFLYSYEAEFIQSLPSTGRKQLTSRLNFTYRYIDDVLSINNQEFENYLGQMCPVELEIKDTTESNTSLLTWIYFCRSGGIRQGTFEIVIEEVLWSTRGSYQTIWSFPLTNVIWHSVTWPYSMTTPYWSDFVPNSTFNRVFHRTFATGVACQQGTFTPLDTWSRPFWTCSCSTC